MKNLTIAHRIMLMIGTSVLALLLVGLVGLSVGNSGANSIKKINDGSLARVQTLGDARQIFMDARVDMYVYFLNTDDAEMDAIEKRLETHAANIAKLFKRYEGLLSSDDDKRMLEADASNVKTYLALFNRDILPRLRKYENEYAHELMVTQLAPLGAKALQGLNDHMAFNTRQAAETTEQSLSSAKQGKTGSFVVILFGIVVVGVLGYFLLTNISRSLKQIQSMVSRVESDLDFTIRATVTRHDEIGLTTLALNRLLGKMQGNLRSIADGAKSVASSAQTMASTSTQVATTSTQQSEAASDMAATVQEMTVSINHVSDRAQEANRLSSESGRLARSGETIIGQTADDIHDIAVTVNKAAELIHGLEEDSHQISQVVAVIKEVADQTNLLALNAAIEAARAGEQGRGFAVVADEVRKLAERTAISTQEISSTIATMRASASNAVSNMQGVVDKVALGVDRAQQANDSIKAIGEGSRHAIGMVEEIALAIREQSAATNNIAAKVERIAQMSEQGSTAAKNGAQAACELDRLASDMQRIVSTYQL